MRNYRSLRDVDVPLGPLNVLVGPNGSGKSTLLDAVRFLAGCARHDLESVVGDRGGYESLRFRDGSDRPWISIDVEALASSRASVKAPDTYALQFRSAESEGDDLLEQLLVREEEFSFEEPAGQRGPISVVGSTLRTGADCSGESSVSLEEGVLALMTLPKLGPTAGGTEVKALAGLFRSLRDVDIDVAAARRPSATRSVMTSRLRRNASNLGSHLQHLADQEPATFEQVQEDARLVVPGLREIVFRPTSGAAEGVVTQLVERGLDGPIDLGEASFGSVRALALLALLHDPRPARITCVEDIDHRLHPYVLDRLVELLREASQRTQLLVATHSPALVNRLHADELIVCERDADGSSRIPAIASEDVRRMEEALHGELELGELWFTGALGGVPQS